METGVTKRSCHYVSLYSESLVFRVTEILLYIEMCHNSNNSNSQYND